MDPFSNLFLWTARWYVFDFQLFWIFFVAIDCFFAHWWRFQDVFFTTTDGYFLSFFRFFSEFFHLQSREWCMMGKEGSVGRLDDSKGFVIQVGWFQAIWLIFGGFLKCWYPQIIHFNRVFHYKTSNLGYPYFGNTHLSRTQMGPLILIGILGLFFGGLKVSKNRGQLGSRWIISWWRFQAIQVEVSWILCSSTWIIFWRIGVNISTCFFLRYMDCLGGMYLEAMPFD